MPTRFIGFPPKAQKFSPKSKKEKIHSFRRREVFPHITLVIIKLNKHPSISPRCSSKVVRKIFAFLGPPRPRRPSAGSGAPTFFFLSFPFLWRLFANSWGEFSCRLQPRCIVLLSGYIEPIRGKTSRAHVACRSDFSFFLPSLYILGLEGIKLRLLAFYRLHRRLARSFFRFSGKMRSSLAVTYNLQTQMSSFLGTRGRFKIRWITETLN